MGQLERLSYLWIGVRELAKAPAAARIHDLGGETQRLLSLWNSSAAWYGLHGAHPMGCLAALNDLGFIRRESGAAEESIGARASAYIPSADVCDQSRWRGGSIVNAFG